MILNRDSISLINHASIFIESNKKNILSDPWVDGEIFNNGWKLIYTNKEEYIKKILSKTNYIYLSHEHPDHFSVSFFKKYYKILNKKKIKIIFQDTKDKRLKHFLENKFGLNFIILSDKFFDKKNKNQQLTLYKNSYIDSSLIYKTKNFYHINFNDCNFEDEEIKYIKQQLVDKKRKRILYIQFSYAAYRSNNQWLKDAALYKLKNIKKISKLLNTDLVIPFASFIHFSNIENQNLNKFKNTCKTTSEFLTKNKINHCFLNPLNHNVSVNKLINSSDFRKKINSKSILFWDKKFSVKLKKFTPSVKKIIDNELIEKFLNRVRNKNSIFLMYLIRFLSMRKIFGDVIIYLTDTKKIFKINFFSINQIKNKKNVSLHMKSEVFFFMLKEIYGVDTIIVNGRFKEVKKNAYSNLILALGFSVINQSNYGIDLKTLFNKFFFKKIIFALKNVKSKKS